MITHLLPVEDWRIVADTDLGRVLPLLTSCADDVKILAAFDDSGELVGCWGALRMVHVEGVWVTPRLRGKASVQRRMMRAMKEAIAPWGVSSAVTGATERSVEALIMAHGGTKLPPTYVFPLGGM